MAEIKLSSTARRDLAEIHEYGADQFGEAVAAEYTRGFNEAFDLLARHPLAGQARPKYGKGTRCKIHGSHRILYRVTPDAVFVQRIMHHSQDVRAGFKS